MRGYSVLGTGIRAMGYEPEPPNEVILTFWITLIFVPVIPIGRKRCRYICDSTPLGPDLEAGPGFDVLEKLPLSLTSVVTTYLGALVALSVTLAPTAYMIWRIQGRAATFVEFILVILCAVWPVVFVVLKERRDRLLLESTWTPERSNLNTIIQLGGKANREAVWSMKHVFSERIYLGVMIFGCLPGAAVAALNNWGEDGLKFSAAISAALCLGATLAVDRLLVRLRAKSRPTSDETNQCAETEPK